MSIKRRLERLEAEHTQTSLDFPDWDLTDQVEGVAETLYWYRYFHSNDAVRYPATDREIHILGLLCAAWELGDEGGEHTFRSGLTVRLIRDGGYFKIDAPSQIRADDLPDWTRELFERMEPEKQPKRDEWLYLHRHWAKKDCERMAWHDEHGWEKPTPEHLVTW